MKKSKSYQGQIPFDIYGNQLHYAARNYKHQISEGNYLLKEDGLYLRNRWPQKEEPHRKAAFSPEQCEFIVYDAPIVDAARKQTYVAEINTTVWIDNYEFEDSLEYTGFTRGRSAANLQMKSIITGREYTVFITDLGDMFRKADKGIVSGTFTFCKRGANFGTVAVPAEPLE